MGSVTVSVVVPVYSGERYLANLVERVETVRNQWAAGNAAIELTELIFVDDCAVDGSGDLIDRLAAEKPWVVALHLGRNSGQHAATMAGCLYTSSDWVVTLDEDLQHPPERIIDLLRAASETASDIIYAHPTARVHGGYRDFGSRSYKRVISWLTTNPHAPSFNSFRLMRGSIARAAASACSYDTYFDVALFWFTDRCHRVEMDLQDDRFQAAKHSGYSLRRLVSHARRLLMSSQVKVLRLGAAVGLLAVAGSVLAGLFVLAQKLLYANAITVQGWTSLILTVMFFGGLTVLMLGITLEYMSMLIMRSHGRPLYFVIDRSGDKALRDYCRSA